MYQCFKYCAHSNSLDHSWECQDLSFVYFSDFNSCCTQNHEPDFTHALPFIVCAMLAYFWAYTWHCTWLKCIWKSCIHFPSSHRKHTESGLGSTTHPITIYTILCLYHTLSLRAVRDLACEPHCFHGIILVTIVYWNFAAIVSNPPLEDNSYNSREDDFYLNP